MIRAEWKMKRPDIAPYDGHRASDEISASTMACSPAKINKRGI